MASDREMALGPSVRAGRFSVPSAFQTLPQPHAPCDRPTRCSVGTRPMRRCSFRSRPGSRRWRREQSRCGSTYAYVTGSNRRPRTR
eukprot:6204772-Pleurochrysis_carterae.AAC.1